MSPRRNHEPTEARVYSRERFVILGLFLSFALFLRFFGIAQESMWGDEFFTWNIARMPWEQLFPAIAHDLTPTFFYGLMHQWIIWFGESELALRSLSALIGAVGIPLVVAIGWEIYGFSEGVFAGLLVLFSTFLVHYAQEARMYGILFGLAAAMVLFFVRWLKNHRWIDAAAFLVVSLLAGQIHNFAWFVWAACLLNVMVEQAPDRRLAKDLFVVALVPLLSAPWLIKSAINLANGSSSFWYDKKGLEAAWNACTEMAGPHLEIGFLSLMAVGMPVVLYDVWGARCRASTSPRKTGRYALLLVLVASLPPLLLAALSIKTPSFLARYLMGAVPALAIIMARAVMVVRPRLLAWGVGLFLLTYEADALAIRYAFGVNIPWRDAIAFVEANSTQDEEVYFFPRWNALAVDYYLRDSKRLVTGIPHSGPPKLTEASLEELKTEVQGKRKFWLLLSGTEQQNADLQQLVAKLQHVNEYRLPGVLVMAYAPSVTSSSIPKQQP